jgi:hypothetical protein
MGNNARDPLGDLILLAQIALLLISGSSPAQEANRDRTEDSRQCDTSSMVTSTAEAEEKSQNHKRVG